VTALRLYHCLTAERLCAHAHLATAPTVRQRSTHQRTPTAAQPQRAVLLASSISCLVWLRDRIIETDVCAFCLLAVLAMRSFIRCPIMALLLAAAVSLCLLQSVQAQTDYASCAGTVCTGQSSTASGTDRVVHCCPTGGHISNQVNNNVYCSQKQDCSGESYTPRAGSASRERICHCHSLTHLSLRLCRACD
jgi:hypothetical protein